MIINKTLNAEFHQNGELAYTETLGEVHPDHVEKYPKRICRSDGTYVIRIGLNAKYFDNGQLAWKLNYDENGNLIKENNKSFHRDGTPIIF